MSKKKIAILGGGMSSLITAYELTSLPGWQDDYEITVYQQGWRLGGKGASGRGQGGDRIEEHGLHILFGSYENTFRIMRECYAALEAQGWPWTFADAFKPGDLVVMMEQVRDTWERWDLRMPAAPGEPGVGDTIDMTPMGILKAVLAWIFKPLRELLPALDPLDLDLPAGESAEAFADRLLAAGEPPSAEAAVRHLVAAHELAAAAEAMPAMAINRLGDASLLIDKIASLMEVFATALHKRSPEGDANKRRRRMIIDFGLAAMKGVIRKKALFPKPNWFVIDDQDLRDFLADHGAEPATLASPLLDGCYDSIFSADARRAGAGTVLHGLCRSFLRKGAMFYRMQAGMGDVVFAPLYRVLEQRGVRFEFFHRVEDVQLSADRQRVERIVIDQQVALRAEPYRPLHGIDLHKDDGSKLRLECWPSEPDRDQMVENDDEKSEGHDLESWWDDWRGKRKTLEFGSDKDFEIVVLGISVGAIPYICRDLIEDPQNGRFTDMALSLRTATTQAVELWLERDSGWQGDPPVVIPFARPFDTWADMSHLRRRENLPASVRHIAYLCSSLEDQEPLPPRSDHEYPARLRSRVLANAKTWLKESARFLWPDIAGPDRFDWNALHAFGSADQGEARLARQHYCATVNPSDRYVLAVPGSSQKRLRAHESGYENLFLAGDWTLTAFSAGCLEAATMSGIAAARAIDRRVAKARNDWLPEPLPEPMTMGKSKAGYVIRDGEMLVVPPVGLDIKMNTFFVRADFDRLTRLCDAHLNRGPTVRYRPVGSFVIFYCADMDNVVSSGNIRELDFGIWIPVYAGRGEGNAFKAERLLTYTPYLWVDNSPALVGGRTVFGFPKHIGDNMHVPKVDESAIFSMETFVTQIQGGTAERRLLLDIRRHNDGVWKGHTSDWSGTDAIDGALKLILDLLGHLPKLDPKMMRQLFAPTKGMPMVFLKQFPEADGTWNAAYQAILEGPIEITGGTRSGQLEKDYEVSLFECWSHDIVATLGLKVESRRPLPDGKGTMAVMATVANAWMEFRAKAAPATVIWKAD